jgi:hypothetical protein
MGREVVVAVTNGRLDGSTELAEADQGCEVKDRAI